MKQINMQHKKYIIASISILISILIIISLIISATYKKQQIEAHYQAQIYNPKNIIISHLTNDPIYRITTPLYTSQGDHEPFEARGTYGTGRKLMSAPDFDYGYQNANGDIKYVYFTKFKNVFWPATLDSPSGLVTNTKNANYRKFINDEAKLNDDYEDGKYAPDDPPDNITNENVNFSKIASNTPYPYTDYKDATKNFVAIQDVIQPNTIIPTITNINNIHDWFKPISLIRPNWYLANICLDNYVKPGNIFSKIRINKMDYFTTSLGLLIPASQIAKIDKFNTVLTKKGHLYAIDNLKRITTLQKGQHYITYNNILYDIPNKVKIKQLNLGPKATSINTTWYHTKTKHIMFKIINTNTNSRGTPTLKYIFNKTYHVQCSEQGSYYKFKGSKSYIKLNDIKAINGQPIKQY